MNAKASRQQPDPAAPEAPEPDRLEGYPHPRETHTFFGNPRAEHALLEAVRSGRLHHAWLLTGPDGVGKATLAYRFARFVFIHPPGSVGNATQDLGVDPDISAARQVAALSHPNLLVLRRPWQEKTKRLSAAITVDEVRRLKAFLGRTAGDGSWRVVIVDKADELNLNAANALLKSLEEPPARCVFLLISPAPGRLPVTIRSRCRRLSMTGLDDAELTQAVQSVFAAAGSSVLAPERLQDAVLLAQGSVRQAIQLLSDGGLDLHDRLVGLLNSLPKLDYAGVHALADTLAAPGNEAALETFQTVLDDIIWRAVRYKATGTGLSHDGAEFADNLIGPSGLAQWAELWETLQRARADAQALNLDRKNLILGTFFRLEDTARQTAGPRP